MRLALYEPDIPQNVAAIVRLCACFDISLDIIAPLGFIWDERKLKRVSMDYLAIADIQHHESWNAFRTHAGKRRVVLLTTKGATPLPAFRFADDDILLLGRESAGVPDAVHNAANAHLVVPIRTTARSLNVAQTAAIALAEGLRQTDGFPTR
ncbi:MAG: tRNA (cytidine(34)-2'-O)-methyltransferase [Rhodospirillaceae bacterium]|nr:tRNA (cytidine(34)-2'-O)-methyltransferase [Rhodospirillaceae bacterium]